VGEGLFFVPEYLAGYQLSVLSYQLVDLVIWLVISTMKLPITWRTLPFTVPD
jgi:hypothetical protein